MKDGYAIVEQFFDSAIELRTAFESHFHNPQAHAREHQVWNYWYVPDAYTYLKTDPTKVIPGPLVARFVERLNTWALATFGLSTRSNPWLSLYINGCGQTIHNDSLAGQMGYVYSITKWEERNFLGGETLLFRPGHYWETERIKTSGAGTAFYDKVPSRFNQLLVFDDRLIHGVQPIQGTMDPLEGRVVLHGHLRAEALVVNGPLNMELAVQAITLASEPIRALVRQYVSLVHGFVTLRLSIEADGRVAAVRSLCDRILPLSSDTSHLDPFKKDIVGLLSDIHFPPAAAASELTLPILIGV
jgi:hypothetical protein